MTTSGRRGLFWQVYLTLLASLFLFAALGAVVAHLLMGASHGPWVRMRGSPGLHALMILLMLAGIVALAAYPVMSRLTRRLETLRGSVEAWGAGDLSRRAKVDGDDEIASVSDSFNTAADRVDALLASHRALLMHASHELRSPLARLAMAVEIFASHGDAALAASIRAEIAELDSLVDEILLSSRLEHGADVGGAERVDCLALVAEEAARSGVLVRPVADVDSSFDVFGSPRLLRRMIRNLVDNAVKHGAPPVEIAVSRGELRGETAVSIAVWDHGPGIAEDLRERVFEPFFRPAGWSEEAGGWGLGLSLVRQIARRHRGDARIAVTEAMTAFIVDLPISISLPPRP